MTYKGLCPPDKGLRTSHMRHRMTYMRHRMTDKIFMVMYRRLYFCDPAVRLPLFNQQRRDPSMIRRDAMHRVSTNGICVTGGVTPKPWINVWTSDALLHTHPLRSPSLWAASGGPGITFFPAAKQSPWVSLPGDCHKVFCRHSLDYQLPPAKPFATSTR